MDRILLSLLIVACSLAVAEVASAQDESAETAASTEAEPAETSLDCTDYVPPEERADVERLALRGVTCFEAGEYLTALRHYRRASELSDANLLNAAIGRTFQELGYPFIARSYYRDYLAGKVEESQGRQKIKGRLKTVEEQLASKGSTVRVESYPPDADVYVVVEESHWEDLGRTPIEVEMLPGKYTFVVKKEGFMSHTQTVPVAGGLNRTVDTELVSEDATFDVSGKEMRRAGVITMAAGIPLIAGGTVLYLVGSNKRSAGRDLGGRAGDEEIMEGAGLQQWGLAAGVVGVLAVGTGAGLYLVGRGTDRSTPLDEGEKGNAGWAPIIGPAHVGVRVRF